MNARLPIPRTGVVHGMSNAAYHAHEALSKSQLAKFLICPAQYEGLYLKRRASVPETASQRAGTLLHTLVLEPDTFKDRYAVGPDVSRATKVWKEWEASIRPGVTAIKGEEYEEAKAQAESMLLHSDIAEIRKSGHAEASAFCEDEETGLWLRVRPDWIHELPEGLIVLDVKTCDPRPHAFAAQCNKNTYHVQDAMYSDVIQKATGKPVLAFLFGGVDTNAPYLSACYELDDDSKETGRIQYRRGVTEFAKCKAENKWPGYEGVRRLSLPRYALETQE